MSESIARLALPIMMPAQAQKHVTHNEALEKLDLVVQLAVASLGALTRKKARYGRSALPHLGAGLAKAGALPPIRATVGSS